MPYKDPEDKKKYQYKYVRTNKDKIAKRSKAYRDAHPEVVAKMWENSIRSLFGINADDYNKMFDEQGGCCAVCGKHQTETKKRLFVDHDHKTGLVRGLLCQKCNMALGMVDDKKSILEKLISYLEKHHGK